VALVAAPGRGRPLAVPEVLALLAMSEVPGVLAMPEVLAVPEVLALLAMSEVPGVPEVPVVPVVVPPVPRAVLAPAVAAGPGRVRLSRGAASPAGPAASNAALAVSRLSTGALPCDPWAPAAAP
jgi:hypothetical protein